MDGSSIAQWIAVGIIGTGLAVTWIRNGRSQSKDLGSLETEVKNISNTLNDGEIGLNSLSRKISEFQTHCATVSTALKEKVKGHDEDIKELKSGGGKS